MSKYVDLQHRIANKATKHYKAKKEAVENGDTTSFHSNHACLLTLFDLLDQRAISNNKLDDVHTYVKFVKEFKQK